MHSRGREIHKKHLTYRTEGPRLGKGGDRLGSTTLVNQLWVESRIITFVVLSREREIVTELEEGSHQSVFCRYFLGFSEIENRWISITTQENIILFRV